MRKSFLTSPDFWVSTIERSIKTFAQVMASVFLADSALNVLSIEWSSALAVSGTAGLMSLLTSVASGSVSPSNSPSLVGEPPK